MLIWVTPKRTHRDKNRPIRRENQNVLKTTVSWFGVLLVPLSAGFRGGLSFYGARSNWREPGVRVKCRYALVSVHYLDRQLDLLPNEFVGWDGCRHCAKLGGIRLRRAVPFGFGGSLRDPIGLKELGGGYLPIRVNMGRFLF